MTIFLLDTNVLSELSRGDRADPSVNAWLASVPSDQIGLGVMVIAEILTGIERVKRRDPDYADRLSRWIQKILRQHRKNVVLITPEIASVYAQLQALRSVATVDGLIAASARHLGAVLVTRNVKDFTGLGVSLLNPFESA